MFDDRNKIAFLDDGKFVGDLLAALLEAPAIIAIVTAVLLGRFLLAAAIIEIKQRL